MKNNFETMLKESFQGTQEKLQEAADKDGLFGVKISDKVIAKFKDKTEQGRVKKVVDAYKRANPSVGDKTLLRLAGMCVKMPNATVKDIISAYDCATSDCYKEFLNIGKE